MKIYITKRTILLFIVCIFGLNSCYDLNQEPFEGKSSLNFYGTNEEAKQGIMGIYAQMKVSGTFGDFFLLDCLSDIAWGSGKPALQPILTGKYTDRYDYITKTWQQSYQGIMLANRAVNKIGLSEGISDNVKKETIGEAKFMRALYYFNLLNMFGGVPIYDESTDFTIDFNNMTKPRSTEQEVRNFILSDLKDAIKSLPEKWSSDNYGRATKGAATALRGKVYLYAKDYEKAKTDFEAVKNSGLYSLYADYAELFTMKGDKSPEMIFAIQNTGGKGKPYGMPFAWRLGSNSTYGYGWNNSMPTNELADMYETKEGKQYNWDAIIPGFTTSDAVKKETFLSQLTKTQKKVQSYPKYLQKLKDMYKNRDPRMMQTLILPYTKYIGFSQGANKECDYVIADGVNTVNGFVRPDRGRKVYLWRKFVPVGNMGGINPARTDIPINFPLIRYADVLLMLAECENELGNQGKAVEYINEIRQRPSTNMPPLNSGPAWLAATTKSEVFKRIVNERAVELAGEGLRFWDLKRWGKLESLNDVYVYDLLGGRAILKRKVTKRDYLWPIPGAQQDIHTLKQNPGW